MQIIIWFVIWFIVWGIYNLKFNWNKAKTKFEKYYLTSGYFIISCILAYYIFRTYIFSYIEVFILSTIIAFTIGCFFSFYYPYYKHIRNGRYFLVSLVPDILFQQIMVLGGVGILRELLGGNYHHYYFGLMFFIAHLPVLFLGWAKLKYLYIILTLLGGIFFSYVIVQFSAVGLFTSFMLHYLIYTIFFYKLRDERKI